MADIAKTLTVNAPELAFVVQLARALPAECRRVFTLRKVYGYSGKEIASRLGIPEQAVDELLIQAARVCAHADNPADTGLVRRRSSLLNWLRLRTAHE
jgi:DNA-directed RNA polymerase specialized sigma24 family protein